MSYPEFTTDIFNYLDKQTLPDTFEAAVILGSGLGGFVDQIKNTSTIPYHDIPGMPVSSVEGHAGELIFGKLKGQNVMAFSGRFHHYEGFPFKETATPVYIANHLGAKKLIVSNAAGAINTSFSVGDLMVIESVIRSNVAISPRGNKRHRYNHHQWVPKVRKIAAELGLVTQQGTYMYVTGPNYETKAEIRSFRKMGADAVGMSTATELFEAARLDLKSSAISLITNMSTGVTGEKLDHEEVKEAADARKDDFAKLVKALIEKL
ncbi:purine-nucleoside phosphorylase [Aliifodinibius salipaludis]|uniref:Purine nucleoside phosphorylase n=1 Tax=Fodinibius salipaludis TaxID=2032627 RepID=A0A2A2GGF4_9BACT|nr:purine-nucleoside phosphorylase [Aliifodinibius salipaludis]PAU95862.1 purine-nucleoside phosphorylase [Aliifodinibius salipaludis]